MQGAFCGIKEWGGRWTKVVRLAEELLESRGEDEDEV